MMGGEVEFDPKKTLYENVLRWTFSQGTSSILLVAILATVVYVMKYEVPEHLKQIHTGYLEIEERNAATHKEIITRDDERHAKLEAVFEKQTDRLIEAYRKPQ